MLICYHLLPVLINYFDKKYFKYEFKEKICIFLVTK